MHIAQVGFVKGRNVVHTVARNTSCNSGWLRLLVQTIFGTLIVSSFILIMLVVVGKPDRSSRSSRCTVSNCRVTCTNAPYYGDYEEDVINTAAEANRQCESISLKLIGPTFKGFQIPHNWFWSINANIRELSIVGGNTKHIASEAFMSPFGRNIKILTLEEIEINIWEEDMLVGLSDLENFLLRDVILTDIRRNALAPVDDSLKFLDIKASNVWDPVNVTGTTRLLELTVVDFSFNGFPHNNLGNQSFFKLRACKVLFLNSCHIVTIEPGTFDYLENIQILYLNDNSIVNTPDGLFNKILPRTPRIALHDNLWHCNCSRADIRSITQKELLIIDPICHFPINVAQMTFSDFEGYCDTKNEANEENSKRRSVLKSNPDLNNISKIIYINGGCHGNISSKHNYLNDVLQVITTPGHQNCLLNRINRRDINATSFNNDKGIVHTISSWIKPIFFVQNNAYSMIELISSELPGHGLLWYTSSCGDIVYCVNTFPRLLKIFNVGLDNDYTFCPFNLTSGILKNAYCISYNLASVEANGSFTFKSHELILFICLSVGCLTCGAVCVYGMIQRNPTLLRGNKRVVFVKHRSVDALVLPPKLPPRKFCKQQRKMRNVTEGKNIFVLPNQQGPTTCQNFVRSFSMKSNCSNDVSYVSAIQPTDEELTEWRSKQINDAHSCNISMIPLTRIYEKDSWPYYFYNNKERIYEVPK